jgi:phage-related minor tail protein
MPDDVVIRLGSQNNARPGFRQLQQDIDAVRQDLQQLDGEDAEPEVRANVAQLLGELDQAEAALQALDGRDAEVQGRADVGSALGDLDRIDAEVRRLDGATAEVQVRADAEQASSELGGMKDKLKGAASSLGQGIGQAVGSALMDAVSGSIQAALENETSLAVSQAQFAGDPAAQKEAGQVAGALWAQGYGESLGELTSAVFQVTTSSAEMRDASAADIQAVSAAALDLSQVWGLDVAESIRAAGQLVRTGLVPDTMSGLALIDSGFRNLGPAADDTLDTLTEYSTIFRQLGIDGPRAMNMLGAAIESGAPSTDVAADALKEFAIIATEGPEEAIAAWGELGLAGQQMSSDVAAGGDRAANALDITLQRLREVKDPAEQARLAFALFGTVSEDLQDSLFAMDPTPTTDAYKNMDATLKEVSATVGDTTQTHIEQASRGATSVLASVWGQADGTTAAVGFAAGAFGLWNDLFGSTADASAAASDGVVSDSERAAAGMVGGFGRGVAGAAREVGSLPGRIASGLSGVFGQGEGAGANLAEGFRGGIRARLQAVADSARSIAQRAIDTIRNAFAMRSPSRVGMGIGANLADSVALGMDSMQGSVIESARATAAAATGPLQAAAPGGPSGQLAGAGGGGGSGAGAGAGLVVDFAGSTDQAFAAAFMQLVRSGKIQIRATS